MTQAIEKTWDEEMLERGMERGMERGRIEGALSTLRGVLRTLLTQRFGALPDALVQRIEQTTDLDRLNASVALVYQLTTPDELLL